MNNVIKTGSEKIDLQTKKFVTHFGGSKKSPFDCVPDRTLFQLSMTKFVNNNTTVNSNYTLYD